MLIVPTHSAVSVSMVLVKPAIPPLAKDASQNYPSASAALTDMPVHRALWTETVWAIQAGNASGGLYTPVIPLIIRDALVIRLSAPMSMVPCDVLGRVNGDCGGGQPLCLNAQCETCDVDTGDGCDGLAPVCIEGAEGRRCVGCGQDDDCTDADAQECVANTCVLCDPVDHAGCPQDRPVCQKNGDVYRCISCVEDTDCAGGDLPFCLDGNCQECRGQNNEGCPDWSTCVAGSCQLNAECQDGRLGENETDIDCGGSCPPCRLGQTCSGADDCENGECVGNRVLTQLTIAGWTDPTPFDSSQAAR